MAAFETAIVQQKVFEEALADLVDQQDELAAERERKAAEERKQAAQSGHAVDVIVDGFTRSGEATVSADTNTGEPGSSVDIEI